MKNTTDLLTVESIRNCVYTIRGQQVMLDSDLADIYGYELKAMNQLNISPQKYRYVNAVISLC